MNLKTIKRHIEDHPGYYHDEEEIKYLLLTLDTEEKTIDLLRDTVRLKEETIRLQDIRITALELLNGIENEVLLPPV